MSVLRRTGTVTAGTFALVCIGFGTSCGLAFAGGDPLSPVTNTVTSTTSTATNTVSSVTSPSSSPVPIPSPTDVVNTVTNAVNSTVTTVTKTVSGVVGAGLPTTPPTLPSPPPTGNSGGPSGGPNNGPVQGPTRPSGAGQHHTTTTQGPATSAGNWAQLVSGMARAGDGGVFGTPTVLAPKVATIQPPKVAPSRSLIGALKKDASAAIPALLVVVATVILGGVVVSHGAVLQKRFARV